MLERHKVLIRGLALLVEGEAERLLDFAVLPVGDLRTLLLELRDCCREIYHAASDDALLASDADEVAPRGAMLEGGAP